MYKLTLFLALLAASAICLGQESDQKTLLIFSAKWCGPCKATHRAMRNDKELVEKLKEYEIIDVDFDKEKDLVQGYNIKSVPSFVIYQNGKELDRKSGFNGSQDLLEFLTK